MPYNTYNPSHGFRLSLERAAVLSWYHSAFLGLSPNFASNINPLMPGGNKKVTLT